MLLTVLMVLGVLAVLFGAAALAMHDRDLLRDAPEDRADVDLPMVGLQPEDISSVRLGMAARGYRMSEVDDVLARVASELQSKDARIGQLEAALIEVVEPQVTAAETFAEDPLAVEASLHPEPPRWPEPELEPEPDPEPIVSLDEPAVAPEPVATAPTEPTLEATEPAPEPTGALEVPQPAPPPAPGESAATSISVAHHAYLPVGHPDSHQPMPHPQPTEVADREPQPTGVPDWIEAFPQIDPGGSDEESARD